MLGLAVIEVASGERKPHGAHFYTVFAEERRAVRSHGRFGSRHRLPVQGELAALGMVNGHKHLTLLESSILDNRHRVVDCLSRGTPVAQNLHDLLFGAAMGKRDRTMVRVGVVRAVLLRRVEALITNEDFAALGFPRTVAMPVSGAVGIDETGDVEGSSLALVQAIGICHAQHITIARACGRLAVDGPAREGKTDAMGILGLLALSRLQSCESASSWLGNVLPLIAARDYTIVSCSSLCFHRAA
jgi:hypothetical protein